MATINDTATLTIFHVSFVQKFIYLFPLPLLVSDTECDGRTDEPTNTANLFVCIYIYIYIYIYTHTSNFCIFFSLFLAMKFHFSVKPVSGSILDITVF